MQRMEGDLNIRWICLDAYGSVVNIIACSDNIAPTHAGSWPNE